MRGEHAQLGAAPDQGTAPRVNRPRIVDEPLDVPRSEPAGAALTLTVPCGRSRTPPRPAGRCPDDDAARRLGLQPGGGVTTFRRRSLISHVVGSGDLAGVDPDAELQPHSRPLEPRLSPSSSRIGRLRGRRGRASSSCSTDAGQPSQRRRCTSRPCRHDARVRAAWRRNSEFGDRAAPRGRAARPRPWSRRCQRRRS